MPASSTPLNPVTKAENKHFAFIKLEKLCHTLKKSGNIVFKQNCLHLLRILCICKERFAYANNNLHLTKFDELIIFLRLCLNLWKLLLFAVLVSTRTAWDPTRTACWKAGNDKRNALVRILGQKWKIRRPWAEYIQLHQTIRLMRP